MLFTLLFPALALASSPSGGYAPGPAACPNVTSLVRSAHEGLSELEADWIKARQEVVKPQLINFLDQGNLDNFDGASFLSNTTINIGLAFSGGGYRAMLCGAGQFSALDNRTTNSTSGSAPLGGLVQASTYMAGLSGGSWLMGSIVVNNFSTIPALQGSSDVWDLEHSIISPGGFNIFSTASYWDKIADAVDDKQDAGFNTSITDIWGRGLSQQFVGLNEGGPAFTWSDIRSYQVFKDHAMPFPVLVADGRAPDTTIISLNSTVFEITAFELGSWDPSLYAFTDIKYLGTNVTDGRNNGTCVTGFDNAGFIMGTSSTLFNQFILQLNTTGVSGVVASLATDILNDIGERNDDIAIYDPNPFFGHGDNTVSKAATLNLVDGGEDLENVPLYPLIQPEREVDVVFAFDNSADTDYSWPNGASLVATYERQFGSQANGTIFPYVPDNNTFVFGGLTDKPTFFGCDIANLSSLYSDDIAEADRYIPPLIVYIANQGISYFSNTSTFKLSYEKDEVAGLINNGYNVVTRQNGTLDSDWGTCVRCAIIQREMARRGLPPTDQCQSCYSKYCWNGTLHADTTINTSSPLFDPTLSVKSSAPVVGHSVAAALALVLCVLFLTE